MSSAGAAPRAAVPVSSARAEASRKNGAKSRGPKTREGKARSAQNALKHGMRAQKHVVLPAEDAAEFEALEAALVAQLAPAGALQSLLARRVAIAAWRLARADRIEVELFEQRGYDAAGPGVALIRDGNGTRSFETLLRYRGAAMAEFWRALRTLKALQAEQAVSLAQPAGTTLSLEASATKPAALAPGAPVSDRSCQPAPPQPNGSKRPGNREPVMAYATPNKPEPDRTLHEAAARWHPNEPAAEEKSGRTRDPQDSDGTRTACAAARSRTPEACVLPHRLNEAGDCHRPRGYGPVAAARESD